MDQAKLVIACDFNFAKYHPDGASLPYEATAAKLKDEILRRHPNRLAVVAPTSPSEMRIELRDADYLVAYHADAAWLDAAPRLRWIQAGSAGIDHFFKTSNVGADAIRQRGIMLSSAAGVTRIVIGEHVLALILTFSRGLHRAIRQQLQHRWEIFMADEIYGRTVGIVGLGEIGDRVAELCKSVGMRVIGTKRSPAGYSGPADRVYPAEALPEVLREADYLVLACALSESTRGMIDERSLRLMKNTAVLINIARGEIVIESALVEALKNGTIAGAGLDTFGAPGRTGMKDLEELSPESELWDLPNVVVCPNHASATPRIYEYLAEIIIENHNRLLEGREPRHRVL
jgi:phosphoglycerate dehydrogenase-like enzyme